LFFTNAILVIFLRKRAIATEFRDRRHREERKHRLNREIIAPEVRVSGPSNEPMGVLSLQEALRLAGEMDVDLVEISPTATPPVCRLVDYGKFKYQEQKRVHEAKSKQAVVEVKEVKFRPGTEDGDYNVKLRNIKRFLDDGDKCKITLRFRGREITHQKLGMAMLDRMREDLGELIVVEQHPRLEGRQMVMVISPTKKKTVAIKPATQKTEKVSKTPISGIIVTKDSVVSGDIDPAGDIEVN
jgi:translation initiation factor IF-3